MFKEQDAFDLIEQQKSCWPEFAERITQLDLIKTKTFNLNGNTVVAQINPARIVSSGAKVDAKSIKERKCFLCSCNSPEQQKGIEIIPGYTLLVNPFPILRNHFTIPCNDHCQQEIKGRMSDMLKIAECMPNFFIFYNGPKCGASAPDHMHFQAVEKGQLPFMECNDNYTIISSNREGRAVDLKDNSGRHCISIESQDADFACNEFGRIYDKMAANSDEEPMMNIFADFNEHSHLYTINIFCRKAHRPSQYYSETDFWMISPGAIDMAGIIVLPRTEDFERIDENVIKDVYNQVSL